MRVVLFTGKGGVGKTTAAAGAAVLSARRGRKTLVLSTDTAHSLGDAFGVPAHGEPVEAGHGLYVAHVDSQSRFQQSWAQVRGYLSTLLDAAGVNEVLAEELVVLPGAEEVLALLEVRDQIRSGHWDVVVVDCAPTAETLRLLALPEALGWYVDRVFPPHAQVARALRPVLSRVSGLPAPPESLADALGRLRADLADVRGVLNAAGTSVRLVLTPEAVVVAEARRTLTSLSLFGYRVDGVLVNKVFPDGPAADPWRAGWVQAQRRQLAEITESFAPLPVVCVPYSAAEPLGVQTLGDLAEEAYRGVDPVADTTAATPVTVQRSGREFVLSVSLPFADRASTGLVRTGDDLVITAGTSRRLLALPSVLRRCTVVGAVLRDGRLRIRFEPDPALWMSL